MPPAEECEWEGWEDAVTLSRSSRSRASQSSPARKTVVQPGGVASGIDRGRGQLKLLRHAPYRADARVSGEVGQGVERSRHVDAERARDGG